MSNLLSQRVLSEKPYQLNASYHFTFLDIWEVWVENFICPFKTKSSLTSITTIKTTNSYMQTIEEEREHFTIPYFSGKPHLGRLKRVAICKGENKRINLQIFGNKLINENPSLTWNKKMKLFTTLSFQSSLRYRITFKVQE